MTNDQAKLEVEAKLRKQQLTKPMTAREMTRFCDAMFRNLEMNNSERLSQIRGWAESWQSTWFRTK
jgi:hypothetical protein